MNCWSITDKGCVRRENQDALYVSCEPDISHALIVVCDGMGGAKAGNVASSLAAEAFVGELSTHIRGERSSDVLTEHMENSVAAANSVVFRTSLLQPDFFGMGTTIVAACVSGSEVVILNIGDSRAYHINKNGIRQITRDHSVVEDMIERGEITRVEAKTHPSRNIITRCIGTSGDIICDFFYPKVSKGDYLLLCTDGLTNVISDDELFDIIAKSKCEDPCKELLAIAISRGAPDNVTAVLLRR